MTQKTEQIQATKNLPALTGTIEDYEEKKIGRISLWYNRKFNKTTPLYKGTIEINKIKYRTAIWENL